MGRGDNREPHWQTGRRMSAIVLGLGAAYLAGKSIHIGIKHVNGYRRAFAAGFNVVGKLFNQTHHGAVRHDRLKRQIVGASAADPQTHTNHRNALRELKAVHVDFGGESPHDGVVGFRPKEALKQRRGVRKGGGKGFGAMF